MSLSAGFSSVCFWRWLPLDPDPGAGFGDGLSPLAGSGRQGQGTKVSCVASPRVTWSINRSISQSWRLESQPLGWI